MLKWANCAISSSLNKFTFNRSSTSTRLYAILREFKGGERILNATDGACGQLRILNEKFPDKRLRIAVEAGGCHGFQYKFILDKVKNISEEDDILFIADQPQCSLICDKVSWSLLKDARLDYSKELIGSSFQIIDNPIAASGCGCGVSFDLKPK